MQLRRALSFALALCAAPCVLAVEAGMPAPAMSLAPLEQGAPLSMPGLKGSVVYVDFWASWCVPCRLSMPALDALYRRNKARGFTVVGVNKDATLADARRFLAKVPVTFPLAADPADAAARGFDVKAMPSGYLVDRKGIVRHVHRGFTTGTGAELEREIDSLLREPS